MYYNWFIIKAMISHSFNFKKHLVLFTFLLSIMTTVSSFGDNGNEKSMNGISFSAKNHDIKSLKFLPTTDLDSTITKCLSQFNADSLKSHILKLEAFPTRFMLADNHRDIALWLQKQFLYYGCDDVKIDSFQFTVQYPPGIGPEYTTWQYNVIGTITGRVSPQVEYLLGGHYDDILQTGDPFIYVPGADDNGTAIATCLETLRVFKKLNYKPKATLKIVGFAAEELGLYGSGRYANVADNLGTNLKIAINMDMIGSDSTYDGWKIRFYKYEGSEYVATLGKYIAQNFTSLTPVEEDIVEQSTDSWSFFLKGFPTIWVHEEWMSPFYHSEADVDSNINFPYLTETAKTACGMLIKASDSPSFVAFDLFNPGTGNSLVASWDPNPELDIAGYKIQIGRASGIYDTILITTDTTIEIGGLQRDSTYFVAVSAFDNEGNESIQNEKSNAPALVTLDQGILIVEDSKSSLLNDPDTTVANYYISLCGKYQYTYLKATDASEIRLKDLGLYNAVLWQNNKLSNNSLIYNCKDEVRKYVALGGRVLFTTYMPSRLIEGTIIYPAFFTEGSFMYDVAAIDTTLNYANAKFNEGIPVADDYPSIHVDALKVPSNYNGHLTNIESISPNIYGRIIYRYGTDYDSATSAGKLKNSPVGIEHTGNPVQVITLSYPLFYMIEEEAQSLVDYIMQEKFGLSGIGINEKADVTDLQFKIYPNPSDGEINISFYLNKASQVSLTIFDISGRIADQELLGSLDSGNHSIRLVKYLPSGIYICRINTIENISSAKLLIR
jgi:leucyl aminopeptidase